MKQQIAAFWQWFIENEQRFVDYANSSSYDFLIEIQQQLGFASTSQEYGLALEVSQLSDHKKRLEISADGMVELFDTVIDIVAQATALANWEIAAFRQPIPTPFKLTYDNIVFDTANLVFLPHLDDNDELNIVIFGDHFDGCDQNSLFHYGLTTIDNLIGEYDCVMKIKGYDFVDKTQIDGNQVYPLEELPAFLAEYYEDK